MFVLGTAGHVDHGKSTLVQALTGIDPDRLAEEKRRGLTLDLGFAWLRQTEGSGSRPVGFVDVPGHLDFIRNMLAGVSGIDAALLIVAADEGVMPQTREHLDILELLEIEACIPVLTKIDAAPDSEWLELVELEVSELLAETRFAGSAVRRVSALEGTGLEELKADLMSRSAPRRLRLLDGPARLPIDRVFTSSGFGTVVTGTLVSGRLAKGDRVAVMPGAHTGRIRGMQAYRREVGEAEAGTRLAVNIGGVPHSDLRRGQVLGRPETLQAADLLDASVRLLPRSPRALEHDMEVMVFQGSAEVMTRVRIMSQAAIRPGETGFCQLVARQPSVFARGDRFILRLASPSVTLGGGQVLAAPASAFRKRFAPDTAAYFSALSDVRLERQLEQIASDRPFLTPAGLRQELPSVSTAEYRKALADCARQGLLMTLRTGGRESLIASRDEASWLRMAIEELQIYHSQHALRPGMNRYELQSRLTQVIRKTGGTAFAEAHWNALFAFWEESGRLVQGTGLAALPGHAVRFSPEQEANVSRLTALFAKSPFKPPSRAQILECLDGDMPLWEALLASGDYVGVRSEVVFSREAMQEMQSRVIGYLEERGEVTMAEVRDLLNTSRRYVQPLLEHMDAANITRRNGEVRSLVMNARKDGKDAI